MLAGDSLCCGTAQHTCQQLCDNEEAVWLQAGPVELHDVAVPQQPQRHHLQGMRRCIFGVIALIGPINFAVIVVGSVFLCGCRTAADLQGMRWAASTTVGLAWIGLPDGVFCLMHRHTKGASTTAACAACCAATSVSERATGQVHGDNLRMCWHAGNPTLPHNYHLQSHNSLDQAARLHSRSPPRRTKHPRGDCFSMPPRNSKGACDLAACQMARTPPNPLPKP